MELCATDGIILPEKISSTNLEWINEQILKSQKWVVIIDGLTLSILLKYAHIEKDFFWLCLSASSLIGCWVSPDQKAAVVWL